MNQKHADTEINISFKKENNNLSINDQFSKIEIITLEKNKESIIGQIRKVIQIEDKLYVFDSQQNAIFIFNDNGKFLFKIHNIGKGVGEYVVLRDFDINTSTNNFELLTPFGNIITYDSSGKFLYNFKLPKPIIASYHLSFISQEEFYIYGKTNSKKDGLIFIVNRESGSIKSLNYFKEDHILTNYFITYQPFYKQNNSTYLKENFSNLTYRLNGEKMQKSLILNFDDHNLNLNKIKDKRDKKEEYVALFMNGGGFGDFVYPYYMQLENDKSVFTTFGYKKKIYHLYYDKSNGKYKLFHNYIEKVKFPFKHVTKFNQGFIALVEPNSIDEYLNFEILSQSDSLLLDKVKMDDNPILIRYYTNEKFYIQ